MYQFEGCECPICHEPLQKNEDIVVCPDCGAPYHRSCYAEAGSCVYADQHKNGFEWEAPQQAVPQIDCPSCKAANPIGASFCNHCGQPLQPTVSAADPMADKNGDGIPDFIADRLELSDEIDGISTREWSIYIGPSAPYYLLQFARQNKRGNKLGFVLSAAFFAPYYFFYRRMWGLGVFAWGLNLLLNLPQGLLLFQELGYISSAGLNLVLLSKIGWLASVLWVVVNTLWGFFAIWLYRSHAAKTMRRWKAQAPNEQVYNAHLMSKSGPCRAVIFAIAGLYILSFFVGFGSTI